MLETIKFKDYFEAPEAQRNQLKAIIKLAYENTSEKSQKAYFYKTCHENVDEVMRKMQNAYFSEQKVSKILYNITGSKWEFIDESPDALRLHLESRNQPDLKCGPVTAEVKKGPVEADMTTTFHMWYNDPNYFWERFVHNANILVVIDMWEHRVGVISQARFLQFPEQAYELTQENSGWSWKLKLEEIPWSE